MLSNEVKVMTARCEAPLVLLCCLGSVMQHQVSIFLLPSARDSHAAVGNTLKRQPRPTYIINVLIVFNKQLNNQRLALGSLLAAPRSVRLNWRNGESIQSEDL